MSGVVTRELGSQLFDSGVRIANIWCLAALTDCPPDTIRDFFEDNHQFPAELAWANALFEDEDADDAEKWDEFTARCSDKGQRGFLIVAECMAWTALSATSASGSWGRYRQALFYSEVIETALQQAAEWASGEFTNATAKWSEGQPK